MQYCIQSHVKQVLHTIQSTYNIFTHLLLKRLSNTAVLMDKLCKKNIVHNGIRYRTNVYWHQMYYTVIMFTVMYTT